MRDDQYLKLQDIATKVADVVIADADPENWIGTGTPSKDLTIEARGNAYWCRKQAAASLSVLTRIMATIGHIQLNAARGGTQTETDEDSALEAEIRAANREAQKMLKKVKDQDRKRAAGKA